MHGNGSLNITFARCPPGPILSRVRDLYLSRTSRQFLDAVRPSSDPSSVCVALARSFYSSTRPLASSITIHSLKVALFFHYLGTSSRSVAPLLNCAESLRCRIIKMAPSGTASTVVGDSYRAAIYVTRRLSHMEPCAV